MTDTERELLLFLAEVVLGYKGPLTRDYIDKLRHKVRNDAQQARDEGLR